MNDNSARIEELNRLISEKEKQYNQLSEQLQKNEEVAYSTNNIVSDLGDIAVNGNSPANAPEQDFDAASELRDRRWQDYENTAKEMASVYNELESLRNELSSLDNSTSIDTSGADTTVVETPTESDALSSTNSSDTEENTNEETPFVVETPTESDALSSTNFGDTEENTNEETPVVVETPTESADGSSSDNNEKEENNGLVTLESLGINENSTEDSIMNAIIAARDKGQISEDEENKLFNEAGYKYGYFKDASKIQEITNEVNSDLANKTDEQLNDRLRELAGLAGGFADEMSEDDPLSVEYFNIIDELNKRKKEKEEKKKQDISSDYIGKTDEQLNERLSELAGLAGGFADEMSEDDPLSVEYFNIIDELNKRKKAKEENKKQDVSSDYTGKIDEQLNERLSELAGLAGGFADEMSEDDPLSVEYFNIIDELNKRKKEKEEKKKQDISSDYTGKTGEKTNDELEIKFEEKPFDQWKNNSDKFVPAGTINLDVPENKIAEWTSHTNPTEPIKPIINEPIQVTKKNASDSENKTQSNEETVKIVFMNDGKIVPNYGEVVINKGGSIKHGPVIDPVPLNSKGKPKRFTAKTFSHWEDQNGNVVNFNEPIDHDVILTAKFKFDRKKALAVGIGAAVGALAYVADLAVPTPVPVVSMLGAAASGFASRVVRKRCTNLTESDLKTANTIKATEDIPPHIAEAIRESKKRGYIATACKTAAVACSISSITHGIQNYVAAQKAQAAQTAANTNANAVTNTNAPTNTTGPVQTNPTGPVNTNPTGPVQTNPSTVAPHQTITTHTDVLGGYEPTGQVYGSAQDAMAHSNGLKPYTPSFAGEETFQAYNTVTGARTPVSIGDTADQIAQMVGASSPDQVAVNVMNSDGVGLTWQSLNDLTETVTSTKVI